MHVASILLPLDKIQWGLDVAQYEKDRNSGKPKLRVSREGRKRARVMQEMDEIVATERLGIWWPIPLFKQHHPKATINKKMFCKAPGRSEKGIVKDISWGQPAGTLELERTKKMAAVDETAARLHKQLFTMLLATICARQQITHYSVFTLAFCAATTFVTSA